MNLLRIMKSWKVLRIIHIETYKILTKKAFVTVDLDFSTPPFFEPQLSEPIYY